MGEGAGLSVDIGFGTGLGIWGDFEGMLECVWRGEGFMIA
jgi:hypothetical protein